MTIGKLQHASYRNPTLPVTKAQVVPDDILSSFDHFPWGHVMLVAIVGGVTGRSLHRYIAAAPERDANRFIQRGMYNNAVNIYNNELRRFEGALSASVAKHDAKGETQFRAKVKTLQLKLADAYYQLALTQTTEHERFGAWMLDLLLEAGETESALHKAMHLLEGFQTKKLHHSALALLQALRHQVSAPGNVWGPGSAQTFTMKYADTWHALGDQEATDYDPAKDTSRNGYGLIAQRYAEATHHYASVDSDMAEIGASHCAKLAADYYLKSAQQSTDPTQARSAYWRAHSYAVRQMRHNDGFVLRILESGLRAVLPTTNADDHKIAIAIAETTVRLSETRTATAKAQLDLGTQYFLSGKFDLAATALQRAMGDLTHHQRTLQSPYSSGPNEAPIAVMDPVVAALESARRLLPDVLPSFDVLQLRLVWTMNWAKSLAGKDITPMPGMRPDYHASALFDILQGLEGDAAKSVIAEIATKLKLPVHEVHAVFEGIYVGPHLTDQVVNGFPEYRRFAVRKHIERQVAAEGLLRDMRETPCRDVKLGL